MNRGKHSRNRRLVTIVAHGFRNDHATIVPLPSPQPLHIVVILAMIEKVDLAKLIRPATWVASVSLAFLVGLACAPTPGRDPAGSYQADPSAAAGGDRSPSAHRLTAITPRGGGAGGGYTSVSKAANPGGQLGLEPPDGSAQMLVSQSIAAALRHPDPEFRERRIRELLAGLDRGHAVAALEAFEEGPRGDGYEAPFQEFLYTWGRLDSAAAISYLLDR